MGRDTSEAAKRLRETVRRRAEQRRRETALRELFESVKPTGDVVLTGQRAKLALQMAGLPEVLSEGAVIYQRTLRHAAELVRASAPGPDGRARVAQRPPAQQPIVALPRTLGTVVLLREGRPSLPSDSGPGRGLPRVSSTLSFGGGSGGPSQPAPAAASALWSKALGGSSRQLESAARRSTGHPEASADDVRRLGLRNQADLPVHELTPTLVCEFASCAAAARAGLPSRKALRRLNRHHARCLLRFFKASGPDERGWRVESDVPGRLRFAGFTHLPREGAEGTHGCYPFDTWADEENPPSKEAVEQLYDSMRGYWEFVWDWERRMCPPAFEIEKDFAGGMCLGDDHAAEWDGQSPRPRKLVPGTLGAVGVGAGPIGKTTFTAGENFHGKGDGQLDQQTLAGSCLFMQSLGGDCRGHGVLLPGLGYRVDGADGTRLWAATHEVRLSEVKGPGGETGLARMTSAVWLNRYLARSFMKFRR